MKHVSMLQFAAELTQIMLGLFGSLLPQNPEIFQNKFNQFPGFTLL